MVLNGSLSLFFPLPLSLSRLKPDRVIDLSSKLCNRSIKSQARLKSETRLMSLPAFNRRKWERCWVTAFLCCDFFSPFFPLYHSHCHSYAPRHLKAFTFFQCFSAFFSLLIEFEKKLAQTFLITFSLMRRFLFTLRQQTRRTCVEACWQLTWETWDNGLVVAEGFWCEGFFSWGFLEIYGKIFESIPDEFCFKEGFAFRRL